MTQMDSYIAKPEYSSITGSAVLKSLQNESIPTIDLLVREAIQNSLDASQPMDSRRCRVNFTEGEFKTQEVNHLFKGIDSLLDKKYGTSGTAKFLEIRDGLTTGLTGPIDKEHLADKEHGNFLKLIFDTGKQQSNSDSGTAGGSWGYGKSVYYRTGIGLVLFYTHIKIDEEHYESRLIASLIENEEDDHSLLREMEKEHPTGEGTIGRAWWGKVINHEILPITDEGTIEKILGYFGGLERFDDEDTGTSIIIPYIDEQALLQEVIPSETTLSADEIGRCIFKNSLEEYLRFAIQKWYAPKLQNKDLETIGSGVSGRHIKWLVARVNGKLIKKDDMYKPFLLAQELYNTALSVCTSVSYIPSTFKKISYEKISINSTFKDSMVGCASFIRISRNDLFYDHSMIPLSAYLGKFDESTEGSAIFMFARLPGMILDYKVADRWTAKLPVTGKNEYLFVFFVPKSSNPFKIPIIVNGEKVNSLGEYLRQCEKSDHQDWSDSAKQTIVERLQRGIGNKISARFVKNKTSNVDSGYSDLSRSVGQVLLPTKSKSSPKTSSGGGGNSGGGGSSMASVSLQTGKPAFSADCISIPFSVSFNTIKRKATIGIWVETEKGQWNEAKWFKEMGRPFPFTIRGIQDLKAFIGQDKKEHLFSGDLNANDGKAQCDISEMAISGIKRTTESGNTFDDVCSFTIANTERKVTIQGTLLLQAKDRKYSCAVREVKEVKEG